MTAVPSVPAVAVSAVHLACSLGDTPEAVWAGIEGADRGLTPRGPRHLCGQLARPDGAEKPDAALRLAVHHAGAAWAASGLARSALAPDRVAVVLGTTDWGAPDFRHHLADHRDRALARPHTAADAVALGLTGPREVLSTDASPRPALSGTPPTWSAPAAPTLSWSAASTCSTTPCSPPSTAGGPWTGRAAPRIGVAPGPVSAKAWPSSCWSPPGVPG